MKEVHNVLLLAPERKVKKSSPSWKTFQSREGTHQLTRINASSTNPDLRFMKQLGSSSNSSYSTTMSRKPSDTFTRFTPTQPHASRPAPAAAQQSTSPSARTSTPSPDETSAERVARLRAQHRAQKETAQLSAVDRLIYRGRIWADITHRLAAYTLIGFTGIAGCVALYGLTSLITHNRRQKRAWIEREMQRLHDAQTAFLAGNADPEQLHLLEQERAGDEMVMRAMTEKTRRKEEGILGRVKAFVGRQTSTGEMGQEEVKVVEESVKPVRHGGERILEEEWIEGDVRPNAQFSRNESERAVASGVQGVGLDGRGRPVPMERAVKEYEARQTAKVSRRSGENEVMARTGITGGPLDILANNVTSAVTGNANGDWLSWLRGTKS